jgi:dTDP-4-dehydrorhamnose reductase
MRAVVIGGSGQIGGWLLRHLDASGHEAIGTYATVPCPDLDRLDAADPSAPAWVAARRPDVVFYPAGFTWVDGCERDPEKARAANLDQPLAIARAAADAGARFVYFSTDYLFDGARGPYSEDDPPSPPNVYGRAKRDAEQALSDDLGDRVLIARTCWVFGPERQGKNFAYQVLKSARQQKPLICPSDQRANPSYGPDVARAAVRLVEQGVSGIIHVAGPEWIDRVTFARAIAEAFGYDPGAIVGKLTAELGQGAPRPLAGGLRSERLGSLLPASMRPLAVALADYRARADAGEPPWADPRAA